MQFLINNISKNKIRLNAELKNLNYENKLTLSFSDNSTEEFDYLIVSDGVFSKTKSIILNKNIKPEYFKSIAVRGNLNDYPNEDISLYLGSNFHFVIYPVNQNKEFNFISIIRKQLSNQQLSDENLYTEEDFLNSIRLFKIIYSFLKFYASYIKWIIQLKQFFEFPMVINEYICCWFNMYIVVFFD